MVEEDFMDEGHIFISIQLKDEPSKTHTHALVNCRATGYVFIDEEFAHNHKFPLFKWKNLICSQ